MSSAALTTPVAVLECVPFNLALSWRWQASPSGPDLVRPSVGTGAGCMRPARDCALGCDCAPDESFNLALSWRCNMSLSGPDLVRPGGGGGAGCMRPARDCALGCDRAPDDSLPAVELSGTLPALFLRNIKLAKSIKCLFLQQVNEVSSNPDQNR